jgi:uracil-DNA glycosylase family 4
MKPDSCHGCPLESHGHDFTIVDGTGRNGTMVIAEASGEMEAREGRPLVQYAPAGSVFERTIRRLGLAREDFSITNLARCRPRGNLLDRMSYEKSAIMQCSKNLEEAYFRLRPRVILTLGNLPFSYLTGLGQPGRTVTHCRGYVFPISASYSARMAADADARDVVVLPTYHPSHIRRGASELFGVFARDMMRAVKIARGEDHSYILGDPLMAMYRDELRFQLKPSLDDAWAFVREVEANPMLILSIDIETYETDSLDDDAREQFSDTRIRQIQFSIAVDQGIAMPWNSEFRPIVERLMATPNVKVGWNIAAFDARVLRVVSAAAGRPGAYVPSGPVHDAMLMFRRWQPELPSNLQYAASFVQFGFPWKHLSGSNLPFYGCCDSASCLAIFLMLQRTMSQRGLFDLYQQQVADLIDLPAEVASHGLLISHSAAAATLQQIATEQATIQQQLDASYPESERTWSPEEGYKRTPKQVEAMQRLWRSEQRGVLIGERTVQDGETEEAYVERVTGMIERRFVVTVKDPATLLNGKRGLLRWCKPNPVSPMSRPQIIRYARHHKHEVPMVKAAGGGGEKRESLTLADIELMYGRTRAKFYLLIARHRRLTEERNTLAGLVSEARLEAAASEQKTRAEEQHRWKGQPEGERSVDEEAMDAVAASGEIRDEDIPF